MAMTTKQILQGVHDWSDEKFAKQDGYYESMGVGTAVNLAGQVERTNASMYRTSGGDEDIATGTARIEKISGNTVAWNQLCSNPEFSTESNYIRLAGATLLRTNNELEVTPVEGVRSGFSRIMVATSTAVKAHVMLIYFYHQGAAFQLFLFNEGGVSIPQHDTMTKVATFRTIKGYSYTDNHVNFWNESGEVFKIKNTFSFDLTLIYGEERANEIAAMPGNAGVEQFESDYFRWFGKLLTYEPYDAGSLRSVMLNGLKTTGFNQWDGVLEKGRINDNGSDVVSNLYQRSRYIQVLPNTTYYYKAVSTYNDTLVYYDSQKNFINLSSYFKNNTFTTPANCAFIRLQVNSNNQSETDHTDVGCINLHWSGVKDGTYEPYEEHTISIPTTTMTGKLNGEGESVVIFPDGMKGVNDVHDELYYIGGKTYAVKRVGRVDLGSLMWGRYDAGFYHSFGSSFNMKIASKHEKIMLSGLYSDIGAKLLSYTDSNKVIFYQATSNDHTIVVRDSSYSDAAAFKTAMSGVYLDYELAEPLVYEVDDFTLPARYKVNDWGTEEQLQAEGANGVAAIISCLYGVNAVDLLRRLPENYISKESMDNFLGALGSAMGGTWTRQWNEQNGEFDFSFVANSSSSE